MVLQRSTLIAAAEQVFVEANSAKDTYTGSGANIAFVVANGEVGDDTFKFFGRDDTMITSRKIFDGNNDGLIGFGSNGLLDIDRTSSRKAGEDQLSLSNGQDSIREMRYLGTRDDQYAYADSATLQGFRQLVKSGVEGTVADDKIKTGGALLIDNALGLYWGNDRVLDMENYGTIITTARLLDENNDGHVDDLKHVGRDATFGITTNSGGASSGGTITLVDTHASYLSLSATETVDGQLFYIYQISTP